MTLRSRIIRIFLTPSPNVPTEVSADTSDKVSMIAILTDLQTQLDGHAKVNQEKCLEVETLKNELSQCKQEIYRLDTTKKETKAATADLHKALLGYPFPRSRLLGKECSTVLYEADTLLHPTPSAYWLPANERASQTSNPNSPVTPFVRKSRPPSQVLTSLRNVNAVFPQFEGIIKERTTQKPDYVSEWCFDYAKQFVEQQWTSTIPTLKPPVQQTKKPNVSVNLPTRTKPATEPRKPMPKSDTRNHRFLPSNSVNERRAADHNRKHDQRLQLQDRLQYHSCLGILQESINGKKYVLVIVDDFSRYTWTHFLRSKDETPGVLIDFLTLVQRGLHAQVTTVRTDKGTEFLNKSLHAYFAKEGIRHETSTARTPEQNGVVERRNRTLVEAARTMISAAKVPLFFWAEAIATACFTQNRSLVIPRHEKTPYHIINARKPSVKFFHIFGSLCYIVRDGENLDKMKEKGDACIFVGYSTQSKAYRVFNKRTRMIVETIHVNFDELPQMASDHVSSDPGPQCSTTVLEQDSLSPGPQSQRNELPQMASDHVIAKTVTTSNELELLYSPMFSELLNGTSHVVSKSSAVHAADNPDKHQQHNTSHTSTTTDVADPPPLNIPSTHQTLTQEPTITAPKNIIQAKTNTENA
ncbi:retrovirus-related pol polyprotein from transposon TNT 1-94 [Tanacetum coccineum]